MTDNISICPLCGGTSSRTFDQRTFRGCLVTNRICKPCGFIFQSPRMSEAELEEFYAAEYRRLYQGSEGPVAKDLAVQTQRAKALLAFIQPYIAAAVKAGQGGPRWAKAGDAHLASDDRPNARTPERPITAPNEDRLFLDIGCSAGKLMECFAQAFGCRVVGIEPGAAYRQDDQRRGLEVYASLRGLAQSGQYPCDLISLIHVLEHLPNPVQYLAHLRQELLRPGGWLLLEVPNLYAHECFEVAHLTSFSAHTLKQTLKQAGFDITALRKHGAPRSRLLPLYLTVLARPVPEILRQAVLKQTVSPEPGVQYKRRIGMLRRRLVTRLFPSLAWIPAE